MAIDKIRQGKTTKDITKSNTTKNQGIIMRYKQVFETYLTLEYLHAYGQQPPIGFLAHFQFSDIYALTDKKTILCFLKHFSIFKYFRATGQKPHIWSFYAPFWGAFMRLVVVLW